MFQMAAGGSPFRMTDAERQTFYRQYMAAQQNASRPPAAGGPVIDVEFEEVVEPVAALPAPNEGAKP